MNKISLFPTFFIVLFLGACTAPTVGIFTPTPTSTPGQTQVSTQTPTPTKTQTPQPTNTITISACLQRANFGNPEDSLYILPYPVGKRYKIGQGYCLQGGTHSNQLAYDFDMGFGDDVTAARSGQVVDLDEHFADDGTDAGSQEFNYIFILHEDGTLGFYAHLMQNSILVEVGDEVQAGQVVARVGFSGMPPFVVPCLHFGVYATWPPVEGDDVAVNFRNADGSLDKRNGLYNGSWYEALPWTP